MRVEREESQNDHGEEGFRPQRRHSPTNQEEKKGGDINAVSRNGKETHTKEREEEERAAKN